MADVRSLLRAERQSRRLTHPHAAYTSTGNLICNICDIAIKSERAWGSHLHSTQHNLKLGKQNVQAQSKPKDDSNASEKRKADDSEEEYVDTKRLKEVTPEEAHDQKDAVDQDNDAAQLAEMEEVLARLEREEHAASRTALNAPATISASAISADQLAANATEEQSQQRSRRDEEIEAERDDAARTLEDELEQMDSLQERVRKLRDRREALRNGKLDDVPANTPGDEVEKSSLERDMPDRTISYAAEGNAGSKDEDEDEDSDDGWTFGAR